MWKSIFIVIGAYMRKSIFIVINAMPHSCCLQRIKDLENQRDKKEEEEKTKGAFFRGGA
jgi:adenylate kinase